MLGRAETALAIIGFLALFGFLAFQSGIATKHPQQQTEHDATANNHEHKNPFQRFWEWTTHDPVAFYTSLLALFTLVLGGSTVALWWETRQIRSSAAEDTRTLQRAYISVEPGGIRPTSGGEARKCIPNIEICNVGNLPARNIRWAIQFALDENDRRERADIAVTKDPEGENILPPGGRMTQGGRELIYIGRGENESNPRQGLYLYVWGVVQYEDGFGEGRSTYFCHRYNCVNLRNVFADLSAPGSFRYDAPARISRKAARYHRRGNSAT